MTYQIGEVEELSGVRSNVLRYWETVIPGFAPRKDMGGRRVYTERDLAMVFRLIFLIYEKKYTIEGARNQILHETAVYEEKADAIEAIRQIRSNLTGLYLDLKKIGKEDDSKNEKK